jgi:hypothetical protein
MGGYVMARGRHAECLLARRKLPGLVLGPLFVNSIEKELHRTIQLVEYGDPVVDNKFVMKRL